jgi:hypothetical protein
VLLWIVWAWAVYRYYVYLHDLTATEVVGAAAARHKPYMAKLALSRAKGAAIARERKTDKPTAVLTVRSIEHRGLEAIDGRYTHLRYDYILEERSSVADSSPGTISNSLNFPIDEELERAARRRSWMYVLLNTRYATEYFAPLAIATLPVILWLAFG